MNVENSYLQSLSRLFIYIPTYNRPAALQAQLEALIPQVENHPDRVRVLVSDNASDSDFPAIAARYNRGNVEFRRNAGNIGGNANIALGFIFSRSSEFLWILSDNDIVAPGAIDYLLGVLDSNIDFYCFVDTVSEPRVVEHSWLQGWQEPMDWRMGLISDALYNTETVNASLEDAFYYHNSSFPHLAVACSAAKKKGNVRFKLLPRVRISGAMHGSHEAPTDYSLARVCMPLLVPLFPRGEARRFVMSWFWTQWWGFHQHRTVRYHLYLQCRAVLKHYGGLLLRIMLPVTTVMYVLLYPFYMIKINLISWAKLNLSESTLLFLKKFRFWIHEKN